MELLSYQGIYKTYIFLDPINIFFVYNLGLFLATIKHYKFFFVK